jgi:homoserine kinase
LINGFKYFLQTINISDLILDIPSQAEVPVSTGIGPSSPFSAVGSFTINGGLDDDAAWF